MIRLTMVSVYFGGCLAFLGTIHVLLEENLYARWKTLLPTKRLLILIYHCKVFYWLLDP